MTYTATDQREYALAENQRRLDLMDEQTARLGFVSVAAKRLIEELLAERAALLTRKP